MDCVISPRIVTVMLMGQKFRRRLAFADDASSCLLFATAQTRLVAAVCSSTQSFPLHTELPSAHREPPPKLISELVLSDLLV